MSVLLESNAPHICRESFDDEAVAFLRKYYPEALGEPMAVPILRVARQRLKLRVVERRLSEDFSVLGQMCFTNGVEDIYDKENDEYRPYKVRFGTMIIDPDTIAKRNEGCKNNTIAHECFHWHKHRDYHIAVSVVAPKKPLKIISDTREYDESDKGNWTDNDWMEWQARGIAPRILMPPKQFDTMVTHFIEEFKYADIPSYFRLDYFVINKLAEFFEVSKQSAGIRLEERGYYLRE